VTVGAGGMTAEQIVKAGFLRSRFQWSYRQLSHTTKDSLSVRSFLGLGMDESLSKSALQANLKRVSESTWIRMNEVLKGYALEEGFEDGTIVRGDTTAVESNIHHPTDSSLLVDGVRVLTRILDRIAELGSSVKYSDHNRRAKKALYKINNLRDEKRRYPVYLDLIRVTRTTAGYARRCLALLDGAERVLAATQPELAVAREELLQNVELVEKVIDQACRRVIRKEKVPAEEKVVSFFETHADIIVKGQREVVYGHKVSIMAGRILVLDCAVLSGNPADSTLFEPMIDAHVESYDSAPKAASFDGGFASTANRDYGKKRGVKELTFSKNEGMSLSSLVSGKAVHSMLVRFRAGIEGMISFLKRVFGFSRVYDRGEESFRSTLQCGAVAFNLVALARSG